MITINSFESYQTIPVSYYGRWLICGANSWIAKKTEGYKFIHSLGIRFYAFAGSWAAASLGLVFHTEEGISTLYQSLMVPSNIKELSVLDELRKKELKEKVTQHFDAAKIDGKTLIKGVWLTAMSTIIAAGVVLLMPVQFPIGLILGGLTWTTLQFLCFDEIDNIPDYLPPLLKNQLIGIQTLKKLKLKLIEPEKIKFKESKKAESVEPERTIVLDQSQSYSVQKKLKRQLHNLNQRLKIEKAALKKTAKKAAKEDPKGKQLIKESEGEGLDLKEKNLLKNTKNFLKANINRIKNTQQINQGIVQKNEFLSEELGKLARLWESIQKIKKSTPVKLWFDSNLLILLDTYLETLHLLKETFRTPGSLLAFKIIMHYKRLLEEKFIPLDSALVEKIEQFKPEYKDPLNEIVLKLKFLNNSLNEIKEELKDPKKKFIREEEREPLRTLLEVVKDSQKVNE